MRLPLSVYDANAPRDSAPVTPTAALTLPSQPNMIDMRWALPLRASRRRLIKRLLPVV